MLEAMQVGFALGFGACCIVVGVGGGFKLVQWIGVKLGVKAWDM